VGGGCGRWGLGPAARWPTGTPPAEPIGTRVPPESIRAGRNRTWSASLLPQLTHVGTRSSALPLPSVTRTFVADTRIAHAAQEFEPRALYRWQSTLSLPPAHISTKASVWNPNAVSNLCRTSSGPLPSAIHAESWVCL